MLYWAYAVDIRFADVHRKISGGKHNAKKLGKGVFAVRDVRGLPARELRGGEMGSVWCLSRVWRLFAHVCGHGFRSIAGIQRT